MGGDGPGAPWLQEKVGQSERGLVEVAKAALPPRGACSPSWAEVSVPLLSVLAPGSCGEGLAAAPERALRVQPPVPPVPPLPPSAFPVLHQLLLWQRGFPGQRLSLL